MERKDKKKVMSSFARIFFAFLFVSSWAVLGVALAISSAKVDIGGKITFKATDVQVTVSNATFAGFKTNPNGSKCIGFTTDASTTAQPDITSWTGLDLAWQSTGANATITYTIKNNDAGSDSIKVKFGAITGLSGTNSTMTVSVKNDTANAENLTASGKEFTLVATKTITVTLTFKVTNHNMKAEIASFAVPITMSK